MTKHDREKAARARDKFVKLALDTWGPEAAANAARLVGLPPPQALARHD